MVIYPFICCCVRALWQVAETQLRLTQSDEMGWGGPCPVLLQLSLLCSTQRGGDGQGSSTHVCSSLRGSLSLCSLRPRLVPTPPSVRPHPGPAPPEPGAGRLASWVLAVGPRPISRRRPLPGSCPSAPGPASCPLRAADSLSRDVKNRLEQF